MLTTDDNQINMALTVQTVIKKYIGVWNTQKYQSFAREVDTLNDQLKAIAQHLQHAEMKTEGVTKDKANAADNAVEKAISLAGSAYVYAKKAKNETLKKQFKLRKDSLTNVQGVVMLSRLNDLYDKLNTITDKLADYVSEEELAAFRAAIDNFDSQIVNPRKVIIDRELSNSIIAAGIKELKSIFENMDKLMLKFKGTEFAEEYKLARIVINHGSRKGGKDDTGEPGEDKPKDLE